MSQVSTRSAVAVVAMPLAVDRRALSQAWYDALHVAAPAGAATTRTASAPVMTAPHAATRRSPAGHAHASPASVAARRAIEPGSMTSPPAASPERRAPRSALAAKIERKLAAQPAMTHRLTFSGADGRVQIVLHGEGAKAKIVAICAPHLREAVGRALLEARYHLAGRGIALETSVRERVAC